MWGAHDNQLLVVGMRLRLLIGGEQIFTFIAQKMSQWRGAFTWNSVVTRVFYIQRLLGLDDSARMNISATHWW